MDREQIQSLFLNAEFWAAVKANEPDAVDTLAAVKDEILNMSPDQAISMLVEVIAELATGTETAPAEEETPA